MKNWFKNLVSFGLILIYSISLSVSIQDFLIDSILNKDSNHDISINLSGSKTQVCYLNSDLEPLGSLIDETTDGFQTTELNPHFISFKNEDVYFLNKDNQYLYKSKNIQPGLDLESLLYPFHTFS
jgi:hypothetical protein